MLSSSARAEPGHVEASAAYFGETLLHPGARLGADVPVFERGGHRLTVGAHLGGYRHQGHHVGVLADLEAAYRHTWRGGVFLEARLGAGYLRTFLHGDVYERGADGGFRRVSLAGANAFAPSQSFGAGYDFARRHGLPLSAFVRLGAFEQVPFNSGFNVHIISQLGVAWRLGLRPEEGR